MSRSRASFRVVVSLAAATASTSVYAQTAFLGSELQVNSYTSDSQARPFVDMKSDGGFVVVWESSGQDGDGFGVFARRFNGAGASLGTELQVNSFTSAGQLNAAVGLSAGGAFVVSWESSGQDGEETGVFARRFNAAGIGLGTEFQVNSRTTGAQRSTVVAMDAGGDFVVAWQSEEQDGSGYGVFARLFDAGGAALGTEFQVNTHTLLEQSRPAVGMNAGGDFVVTWQSFGQDGAGFGVFARRFDDSGVALGSELLVNASTSSAERYPAVGVDGDGDFVVSWSSNGQDGSEYGIVARRFSSAGVGLGGELQVNAFTFGSQSFSVVDMEAEGQFAIGWNGPDGYGNGVFARRFKASGVASGLEFRVNTYGTGNQQLPGLAVSSGSFVVTWQSADQDGSANGIFAQRFATAVLDIDGNGSTAALTDGLLVLRFLFGFTGATLVAGVVDTGGCTRCSAGAIEGYLQTLL